MGKGRHWMDGERVRVELELDRDLFEAAQEGAAAAGLGDVPHLVVWLLEGALAREPRAMDKAELEMVETRLRELGYLE